MCSTVKCSNQMYFASLQYLVIGAFKNNLKAIFLTALTPRDFNKDETFLDQFITFPIFLLLVN